MPVVVIYGFAKAAHSFFCAINPIWSRPIRSSAKQRPQCTMHHQCATYIMLWCESHVDRVATNGFDTSFDLAFTTAAAKWNNIIFFVIAELLTLMMIDVIIREIQSVKTKLHPIRIIFYCSGSILLVSLMLIARYCPLLATAADDCPVQSNSISNQGKMASSRKTRFKFTN